MKISFIIPIYKVEQYLEQCVNSVLNQTYKDIEVILVDDGSPDNCPKMCDEFATIDNRIKVVHKPNGGLSDARNAGLRVAIGDYVIFMDSDDFWTDNKHLEQLISIVNKNQDCDFVGFNCSYYYPDTNSYAQWVPYFSNIQIPTNGNDAMVALVGSGTFPMSACMKVIRRQFLIDNELFFEKGILAEDIPWFINVLEKCKKCMFTNQYIYAYRQNVSDSITNSGGERSFNNLFAILKKEVDKIEGRQFNSTAKEALYSFLAYEYCILLAILNKVQDAKLRRKELYSYKWLLCHTDNPKVRMVSMVYRFFGIRITEFVLRIYNKKRKSQR